MLLPRTLSRLSSAATTAATDLQQFYLRLISQSTTTNHLLQIHAHTILTNYQNTSLPTATKLIQRLFDLKTSEHAIRIFFTIPNPDVFLFNVLIRFHPSSISIYSQLLLHRPRLCPDNFSFSFAVNSSKSLTNGRVLHGHSILFGFENDPFVGSAVIGMYLGFSQVSVAEKVFERISDPDVVCCNTFISGLVRNCLFLKALWVFKEMSQGWWSWDSTTLAAILPAAAELQDFRFGMMVHCLAVKSGLVDHDFVVTSLISMYSKMGEVSDARLLFKYMHKSDLVAWNAMIAGYLFNGDIESSVQLFKEMLYLGWKVNSSTLLGLIPVSDPFRNVQLSRSIHGFSVKTGLYMNSSVCTALITIYSRLNDMESAQRLFDETRDKCLISWNAVISGYAQNGQTEIAVSLFKKMLMLKVKPNTVTITSILSACAQLGTLTLGKWINQIIIESDIQPNVFIFTALIDMYAKCGSIKDAREIFDSMLEKNVVSWNAMIAGYGQHGEGQESLRLFKEMLNSGVVPTDITFLSLLYACSHSGLIEDGRRIFHSMESNYLIKSGPEHNACMVDLLGRAGKLNEAFELIQTMPGKKGSAVWGALLGACMVHKNSELAKVASEKLFELDPCSTGHYVLLSNIHSANRHYLEAASIRQQVRTRNLNKTPGCTLIEIGNTVHVFTSGDRSHKETVAIYSKLEELSRKMVEAGYVPVTNAALYDVEDEEKEDMVKVHSEKLAICFGIINTEPGTEIRIIKNLRVCLDCHAATKFISRITKREVIVRDASRFHHVRDGICSCDDYW